MIIALVSKKGGVGKTTTAVSLAAALARRGSRVLLVDLDSQGSTSLSLGLCRREFPPSVADVLLNGYPIADAIRSTRLQGLELLTSSTDLATFDQEAQAFRSRERVLQHKLAAIEGLYDFIFLDCPPSLSLLPTNALIACHSFIVPVMPHYLALEGLRNLVDSALKRCHANGTRTTLLGLLLTMVDYRTKLTRQNVDRIRREYGDEVFAVEVRTNIRLAEAPGFGQTIFQYDPSSTGARAYSLLAEELLLRSGLDSKTSVRSVSRERGKQRTGLHPVALGA